MNMKHTPTPWTDSLGMAQRPLVTAVDNTCDIAAMSMSGGKSLDEAYANAAFIVRARNAHDELVAALDGVLHHDDGLKDQYKISPSLIRQVRAAVAKAKG